MVGTLTRKVQADIPEFRRFEFEHRFAQVATTPIAIPEPSTAILSCLGLMSLLA